MQVVRSDNKGRSKNDPDPWAVYNDELRLYLEFMRSVFHFDLKPTPSTKNGADYLCSQGNFLETQITDVKAYDKKGREISSVDAANKNSKGLFKFGKSPNRVIAYIEYVEIEYVPGHPEKFEARNFKWDCEADDLLEADKAVRERAKAIFSLAYAAKAKGWDKIDFGATTNFVERQLLIQACLHVGLDYSGELPGKSIHPGVQVTGFPALDSAIVKNYLKKAQIDPATLDEDQLKHQVVNAIQVHIDNFKATYTAPIEEDGPRPSPSPSVMGAAASTQPQEMPEPQQSVQQPPAQQPPREQEMIAAFAHN